MEKKDYILIGGMAICVALLLVILFQVAGINNAIKAAGLEAVQPSGQKEANQPEQKLQNPSQGIDTKSLMDDDAVKGNKNAPVTIVEFSDYECPFCVRFYTETFGQIDERYIKTGKVKFVYRDFPLGFHQFAQKAAEAAECAGEQDKYFEMYDKLFKEGVKGGVDSYKQYARDIGLDASKFNECIDTGKMESEIKKDASDGAAAGIKGTPGFFINGQLISGAQPFSRFQQAIETELAKN